MKNQKVGGYLQKDGNRLFAWNEAVGRGFKLQGEKKVS